MEPAQEHPKPPPLPPSPLTEVVEAPPFERLPLPWATLLFALLTGPAAAVAVVVLFRPVQLRAIVGGALIAGVRGLVVALGAIVADRALPSWSRTARWGAGMAAFGLIPGVEAVLTALAGGRLIPWLGCIVVAAARDGVIGGLAGSALRRERSAVWVVVARAGIVWAIYAAVGLNLSGPLDLGPFGIELPELVITLMLAGSLLPVALALGLRLAWRRGLEEGSVEGR